MKLNSVKYPERYEYQQVILMKNFTPYIFLLNIKCVFNSFVADV